MSMRWCPLYEALFIDVDEKGEHSLPKRRNVTLTYLRACTNYKKYMTYIMKQIGMWELIVYLWKVKQMERRLKKDNYSKELMLDMLKKYGTV